MVLLFDYFGDNTIMYAMMTNASNTASLLKDLGY